MKIVKRNLLAALTTTAVAPLASSVDAQLLFDQNVTPDAIFGSGNANGSFTVDRNGGVELGLRAKLRFPPSNVFNSNGDGTYTYNTGSGTSSPPNPEWAFEWSANTDYDGSSGFVIDDLTYELGIDFDPSAATNYLVFDPISIGSVIPYTPPSAPVPWWDHSIGTNATPNGGGTEATDAPTYAALIAANNVAQNSWRMTFFDEVPFTFDPDVPGRYDFYLAAFDGGTEVARTEITVIVVDGASLTLEADACQTDQDLVAAGVQIEVELWLRNPDDVEVTGYQAFLAFDDLAMMYEGSSSSYSATPFISHVQDITTAEVAAGELRLDGNTFVAVGTTDDELLATLVFTVAECDPVSVAFDLSQPFPSELSFGGDPIPTDLVDSSTVLADDTPPVITCPSNVSVQCIADADPGLLYGISNGGLGIYYNSTGGGEVPTNQAYYLVQFNGSTPGTGAPYVFDNTSLTGIPFSWQDLYSGLVWPMSQFGFDLVVPAPTNDGSVLPPVLSAVDYDGVGPSNPMPVLWAFNDYKPHTPDITAGIVFNSIVRSPSPGNPLTDVVITRQDLSLSGTVYTLVLEGVLTSDGIHHWFTPAQLHSPMSNFGLNGLIYFSGTLTYDSFGDPGTDLVDYYAGPVTFTANFPSSATGYATATDNCTLFPVVTSSDTDNGGSGCPGDPLIITRTWTAIDDCGNSSSCVQTITVLDDTDPTFLSVPDDVDVNADAGVCTATLLASEIGAPTATDNCNPTVSITFSRDDLEPNIDDPYDSADSPITITWTATDDCGNTSTYDQIVTVNAVTEVTVTVELIASIPTTRCIHFVTDDCGNTADVTMVFTDHDAMGATPVRATATFEMGCGDLSFLCGKDEQHTQWGTVNLNDLGIVFEAAAVLSLLPGDDDNDGDVDINDVTFLIATFGDLALDGDCPFDGTRDADFDNSGAVGILDYSALTPRWLTITGCACTMASQGPIATRVRIDELEPWIAARADLNRDAVVDHRDVKIFEQQHGLPHTLSSAIRRTAEIQSGR